MTSSRRGLESRVPRDATRGDGRGFTLIELVLVVLVLGLFAGLFSLRFGALTVWQEEGFFRTFLERLRFVHDQAKSDQTYYQLEVDFDRNAYRVGALQDASTVQTGLGSTLAATAGNLTLELASFLNPGLGDEQTFVPPPSFPSLGEYQPLPSGMVVSDVKSPGGVVRREDGGSTFVLFAPQGFTEFAVFHFRRNDGSAVTVMANPFTGKAEMIRGYEDFEWTYGTEGR